MRIASALWHAVTPLPQYDTISSPSGANRARSASGVEEPAVRAEVAAAGPVDRRRDVPGDAVDRLDLAAIALGRARIDDGDAAQPRLERVPLDRPRPGVAQREVTRPRRRHVRRQLAADRDPRLDAAVEQADVGMAEVVEHPPQPGRDRPARVVVGDDGAGVVEPELGHPRGEGGGGGERMPARSRRRREVGVEVDEHRAGQVPLGVVAPALRPVVQPPADVGDSQVRVAEAVLQGLGGDQGHGRRIRRPEPCYPLPRRRDGAPTRALAGPVGPSLRRSSVVERVTVNHLVVGSNPTAGASFPSTK